MSATQPDNDHKSPAHRSLARDAGVPAAGLRVDGVALVRGGRLVQNALSLAMVAGEVTLLRGPNGSGKSPLLRTIAGRLPAAAGAIECDVPVLFIGHADGLSPALTGRQNLADWAMLNGLANDDVAIDAALDRMQARPSPTCRCAVSRTASGGAWRGPAGRGDLHPRSGSWTSRIPGSTPPPALRSTT